MQKSICCCFIAPEFIPVWGGAGSYTVQLLKNLPKRIDIHVVTLRRHLKNGQNNKEQEIQSFFGQNINIHYISDSKDTFVYNGKFQIFCAKEIPKLNKKYHFDLIHSHHAHMPDIWLNMFHLKNIPTVITVHNLFSWMFSSIKSQNVVFEQLDASEKGILTLYPILKYLEKKYLTNSQALIAPSKKCQFALLNSLNIPPENVNLIYNGVDTNFFNTPKKWDNKTPFPNRPLVLFVGRYVAQKGLDIVVKAMPNVVKNFPDVLFIFAGQGDFITLENSIKNRGIPKKNYLNLGFLTPSQLLKFYSYANLFILPSPHENCSLSLLEAMSCQCAVLVANVGGNSEIIKSYKNGLLFSTGNVLDFSNKIIELLKNAVLQKKLGCEARKTVLKEFSIEKMAEKTCNLYKDLLIR